jgi:hypothetical protein
MLREAVNEYLQQGLRAVPLTAKVPSSPDGKPLRNWPAFEVSDVGVQWSGKITGVGVRNDTMTDVDLDSLEARKLAPVILPKTATFGRSSTAKAHYVYEPVASDLYIKYASFLELRASSGHQTMLPGSVHPCGEIVEWSSMNHEPATVDRDDLVRRCGILAASCLMVRHWTPGSRNTLTVAFSHVLIKYAEATEEEVQDLIFGIADLANDEEARKRIGSVVATVKGLSRGAKKQGLPELQRIIGEEDTAKISEWLMIDGHVDDWADVDLNAEQVVPEPWPDDFLPGRYGQLAKDLAMRIQAPIEIIASALIVSVLSVVGTRVVFQPKQKDTYFVPAIMWSLTVAGSGQRKSAALDAAMRPLQRLEGAMMKEWLTKKDIAEMYELPPALLPPPIMIVQSATKEALAEVMQHGPITLHMDEMAGLVKSMDMYRHGKGDDREFYMTAANGSGSVKILRRGGNSIYIRTAYVSLIGTIQPKVAAQHLRVEAGLESGWAARHGLLLFPDQIERKVQDMAPNPHGVRRVFEHLMALREYFLAYTENPEVFEATEPATDLYLKWEAENLRQMSGMEDPMRAHWEKCQSYVAQLALARYLMRLQVRMQDDGEVFTLKPKFPYEEPTKMMLERWDAGSVARTELIDDNFSWRVDADDMQAAIDLVENVLKPHAQRIYGMVTDHPGAEVGRKLVPWFADLLAAGKDRVKKADLRRRYGLENDEKRTQVIQFLGACDCIRPAPDRGRMHRGRIEDARSWLINPGLGT